MTWILGLPFASSAIFNKALGLTRKTQITPASPALHMGLNEMFVQVLGNSQVDAWVGGFVFVWFLFCLVFLLLPTCVRGLCIPLRACRVLLQGSTGLGSL